MKNNDNDFKNNKKLNTSFILNLISFCITLPLCGIYCLYWFFNENIVFLLVLFSLSLTACCFNFVGIRQLSTINNNKQILLASIFYCINYIVSIILISYENNGFDWIFIGGFVYIISIILAIISMQFMIGTILKNKKNNKI